MIPFATLKSARQSGRLNLSGRGLTAVPDAVLRINEDVGKGQGVDFGASAQDRWWDQVALSVLNMASNALAALPSEMAAQLPGLTILDVHDNPLPALPATLSDLRQLATLNAGHCHLTRLPPTLPPRLTALTISHNNLTELPAALGDLAGLETLLVHNNALQTLPALQGLRRLRSLDASNNALTALPVTVGSLSHLTELTLHHNHLTTLPAELQRLTALVRLDLRFNALLAPPPLAGAVALRELQLGSNQLSSMLEFSTLPLSLVLLDLRDNMLTGIEGISRLCALERLDLVNNNIAEFVDAALLPRLVSITVDGNPLRSLRPAVVSKGSAAIIKHLKMQLRPSHDRPNAGAGPAATHSALTAAGKLNLSGRGLSAVVPDLFFSDDAVIHTINLSRNALTAWPAGVEVFGSKLTTLDISANKIAGPLSPAVGALTRLLTLDLRNNKITALPDSLAACSQLSELLLNYNAFSTLSPSVFTLGKLTALMAGNNQLQTIDVTQLQRLSCLTCLDLSNNIIAVVPPELGLLDQTLQKLQLEGNPFKIPRASDLAKGTVFLLKSLRNRLPAAALP